MHLETSNSRAIGLIARVGTREFLGGPARGRPGRPRAGEARIEAPQSPTPSSPFSGSRAIWRPSEKTPGRGGSARRPCCSLVALLAGWRDRFSTVNCDLFTRPAATVSGRGTRAELFDCCKSRLGCLVLHLLPDRCSRNVPSKRCLTAKFLVSAGA